MYTAPSDEAMIWEIKKLKDMGFNMLRKHIKIEPLRWYYHCDRLGMLVWQDFVSGGGPYKPLVVQYAPWLGFNFNDTKNRYVLHGRKSEKGRNIFLRDAERTIDLLYNTVGISAWVPFNEGWGQFDARGAERFVRRADPTRLVDAASGWFDQGGGDFRSRHRYVLRLVTPPRGDGRAFYLSEFGGLNLVVEGRAWCDPAPFGYRFLEDREALARAMTELYRDQLVPLVAGGLAACTYTQVSDVERESNGLMTYDRVVTKVDPVLMARLNRELEEAFVRVRCP